MSDRNQRKIGIILSYTSIMVSTIIQLLYTPLLIRKLGQSEYGLYSLVASIIGYLTLFDLGFGNAIVVYTSKYLATNQKEKADRLHGMFRIVFYVLGMVVFIAGIVLFFNVENLFANTMTEIEIYKTKIMMLILAFNLMITFSFNIYTSIINAYEQFVFQKIIAILNTILKPMIMIPFLFMGFKSITMCVVITGINLLIVILNYMYCKVKLGIKIRYSGFDVTVFKEIFKYSIFIFINIVVDKINWSLDQFFLGITRGTVAVSVYSVATQLNTLFINLSTAVSNILLPKVSKMVAKKESVSELTYEMIKVGRIQWAVIFLFMSGLILVGKDFIIWWVGKEYEEVYYVALLLIIPICIPLIQNLGISICQALNKHKFRAYATLMMAILNAFISYYLSKAYGPIGAAFGTMVALVLVNIISMNIYYQKVIKLNMIMFWKEIIKMTIPFLIPLSVIMLFMNIVNVDGIASVLIYAFIYTILYGLSYYLLSANRYEKELINGFLKRLKIVR